MCKNEESDVWMGMDVWVTMRDAMKPLEEGGHLSGSLWGILAW